MLLKNVPRKSFNKEIVLKMGVLSVALKDSFVKEIGTIYKTIKTKRK